MIFFSSVPKGSHAPKRTVAESRVKEGRTAKAFLSEQGDVKEEGIGLVAMPDD